MRKAHPRNSGSAKLSATAVPTARSASAGDDEVSAYVRRLEHQADARMQQRLPTGDDLAAEFERFLREQHPDE